MTLRERIATLSAETRKRVVLAAVLVLAIGFLMLPSPSELRRFLSTASKMRIAKPSPLGGPIDTASRPMPSPRADAAPAPTGAPSAPTRYADPAPSGGVPTPGKLLGKFDGRTLLRKRGLICIVSVELRGDADSSGQVLAYSTIQCTDPLAAYATPGGKTAPRDAVMAIVGRFLPVQSLLSGAWEAGVLHFHVVKTIGENDACAMSSATMTPWGARQVAFEWEDACGKGEMVLSQSGM